MTGSFEGYLSAKEKRKLQEKSFGRSIHMQNTRIRKDGSGTSSLGLSIFIRTEKDGRKMTRACLEAEQSAIVRSREISGSGQREKADLTWPPHRA